MASPVQNYLNQVATYYQLNQAQQQPRQQPVLGGLAAPIVNVIPPLVIGSGGGGNGGMGINIVGGVGDLGQLRQFQREDRDENRATGAAWLGAILSIIGAAGLACVCSKWNESGDRLEEARMMSATIAALPHGLERAQATQINNKDIQILEKEVSRSRNIVILTAVALASAATAFVAGMFSVQWLITTAIIVGVATAAVGVFAAVYYCMQKSETPTGVDAMLQRYHNGVFV